MCVCTDAGEFVSHEIYRDVGVAKGFNIFESDSLYYFMFQFIIIYVLQ